MSSWQNFVKAKALKTDTVGKERGEPMNYFDKNGNQIKAGMDIRMADGSFERVYETTDAYGNPDLGINASNSYRTTHLPHGFNLQIPAAQPPNGHTAGIQMIYWV